MVLEYEIQRKTHVHVWKPKHQVKSLVWPLGLAHVLHDDHVFLVIGHC